MTTLCPRILEFGAYAFESMAPEFVGIDTPNENCLTQKICQYTVHRRNFLSQSPFLRTNEGQHDERLYFVVGYSNIISAARNNRPSSLN